MRLLEGAKAAFFFPTIIPMPPKTVKRFAGKALPWRAAVAAPKRPCYNRGVEKHRRP